MTIDYDRLDDKIQRIATSLKRQYPQVQRDDIVQEMYVWALERQRKIVEYQNKGDDGDKMLHTSLRRAGWAFCAHEKAQIMGYEPEDQFAYSIQILETLIPDVLDRESWLPFVSQGEASEVPSQADPAHGNTRLAMLCDVSASLEAGSDADKVLIFRRFINGETYQQMADADGITDEAARRRVMRVLERMQKRLGGPKPPEYTGIRRAMSNAAAQALTRNQEDPE